jgi:hypothetical protein
VDGYFRTTGTEGTFCPLFFFFAKTKYFCGKSAFIWQTEQS